MSYILLLSAISANVCVVFAFVFCFLAEIVFWMSFIRHLFDCHLYLFLLDSVPP
jgi:hypothetical protein